MNALSDHTINGDFLSDLHRIRRLLSDAMSDRERNIVANVEPSRSSLPPCPVAVESREMKQNPNPVSGLMRPPLFGSIVEPVLPFGGSSIKPPEDKIVVENVVHVSNLTEVDNIIGNSITNIVDIAGDFDENEQVINDILQDTSANDDDIIYYQSSTPIVHDTDWLERISFIMFVFGWFGVAAGLLLILFNSGAKEALLFDIGIRGICFGLGMVVVRMIAVSMLANVQPQYMVTQS